MKREVEAQLKLAEAMARLADRLEKFQDLCAWPPFGIVNQNLQGGKL